MASKRKKKPQRKGMRNARLFKNSSANALFVKKKWRENKKFSASSTNYCQRAKIANLKVNN